MKTPIKKAIEILEELGNFKNTTDEYHNGLMRGYWSAVQILKEEAGKPCKKFLVIKPRADGKGGIDKLALFFAKDNDEAFVMAGKAFNDTTGVLASYPVDELPDGWIFKI